MQDIFDSPNMQNCCVDKRKYHPSGKSDVDGGREATRVTYFSNLRLLFQT